MQGSLTLVLKLAHFKELQFMNNLLKIIHRLCSGDFCVQAISLWITKQQECYSNNALQACACDPVDMNIYGVNF